jgi:hypothetical protein
VDRKQPFNRLQFNQNGPFHNVIHSKARFDPEASIDDRQFDLMLESQATLRQFKIETGVVGSLEETSTYAGVNRHRGVDHSVRDLVDRHLDLDLSVLRVLCGEMHEQKVSPI